MLPQIIAIASALLLAFLIAPFSQKNFQSRVLVFLSALFAILLLLLLVFQGQNHPSQLIMLSSVISVFLLGVCVSFRFSEKKLPALGFSFLIGGMCFLFWSGYFEPTFQFAKKYHLKLGTTDIPLWAFFQAIIVLSVSIWGALLASRRLESFIDSFSIHASMKILFAKFFKVFIFAISLLWGLSLIGVDISVFAFLGGAIALGIGFGLQNIVSNLLCGIILLIDKSIKPGDVIALNGGTVTGIIHKLTARYVTLRTQEGKEHLIPNAFFVTNNVENWSYSDPMIRFNLSLRVPFESDLDQIQNILHKAASKEKRVLRNPAPSVRLSGLVENAIEVQLRVWISDPEKGVSEIKSNLIHEIWKLFRLNHIEIPCPRLEVSIKK